MRRKIFVFGSNLMGYHGGGAALVASRDYGAVRGVGEGLTGDSYALPTCAAPGLPLARTEVAQACTRFARFASEHPELDFLLTPVGCGIAGFSTADVGGMFPYLTDNVYVQTRLAYDLLRDGLR